MSTDRPVGHRAPFDDELPELYQQIFDSTADGLIIVDSSGAIRFANRQAESLFGFNHAELLRLRIEDLIPQRFRSRHRDYRTHYGSTPISRPMGMNMALRALHRDGHEFPVEISLTPFKLRENELVCANVRDISELQHAREMAVRARQSTAIADFGRVALTSKDVDAVQDEACRLAMQLLDAPRALVVRREHEQAELTVAASAGFDDESLARLMPAIAARCPVGSVLYLPITLATAADDAGDGIGGSRNAGAGAPGHTRGYKDVRAPTGACELLLCAIPGEEGTIGLLGVGSRSGGSFDRDDSNFVQALANTIGAVLQRARAEERLFQSQRLEALGQLTGGVAHDFNNLLTVVSGNLQILEERLDDPLSAKMVRSALRAAGRGADLTRKLLAFSRRQRLEPRAIDVEQLLGSLGELLRRTLGAPIEVLTHVEAGLPAIKADLGMLDTALLNLAVNARDAMPDGGRLSFTARRVSFDAEAAAQAELTPADYVEIAVSDTGTGMKSEVLARAFEPFFTTKDVGKGSGLGLSLVYGFIKQSGGHIRTSSEVGAGTRFCLYLPTMADGPAPRIPDESPAVPRGSETVLVVEDDGPVRELAVQLVSRLGYRVLQAADAEAALALLGSEPGIALLFTDVVLRGGLGGPDLAREAVRRHPALKVLFTSGYAPRLALPDGNFNGVVELLSKPYRISELARMLRRALDGTAGSA